MDYSKFNINPDDLLTSIAYNLAESPTTQAYQSVAAQNNPDWAGFVGDIYRQGDIDRAGFNLGLQALTANNAAKAARDKENREFARQKELLNIQHNQAKDLYKLKRMYELEDRNNLLSLDLPEYEKLNYATDFSGKIDPKQKQFVDDYNAQIDDYDNEQDYTKKMKLSKNLDRLKKKHRIGSMINAPEELGFWDRLGLRLSGLFNDENAKKLHTFTDNTNRIQADLIGRNVRNPFDTKNVYNVSYASENYRRNNQLGLIDWNTSDKTVEFAQKLINSPEVKKFFGTNNINNFQLLDDPTNFGLDKTHILDKKSGQIYRVYIDNNNELRIFDPFED